MLRMIDGSRFRVMASSCHKKTSPISTVTLLSRRHGSTSSNRVVSGSVLAWGRGSEYQTGSPPLARGATHHGAFVPAGFSSSKADAVAVSAGSDVSGIINSNGQTFLFGTGCALGLGDGITCAAKPSALGGEKAPVSLSQLALGESTSVAINWNGQALVFGRGIDGQLGLGGPMGPVGSYHGGAQEDLITSPRALHGEPLASIAVARHRTLLLTKDGVVFTAGSGFHGELGAGGASGVVTAPASIVGLPNPKVDPVTSIAAGHTFTLAATQSGRLFFWGQVGHGGGPSNTLLRSRVPTELTLPNAQSKPLSLAAGLHHALITDHEFLWALGSSWEHGGFDSVTGVAPRIIPLPRGVRHIAQVVAGPRTAGIVDGDGRAWLAGRLDSPLLLGGETGPTIANALSSDTYQQQQQHQKGGTRAGLLTALGLEDEIGLSGGKDGDGIVVHDGSIFAPRLTLVQDVALDGRRIIHLALGKAHALAVVEE